MLLTIPRHKVAEYLTGITQNIQFITLTRVDKVAYQHIELIDHFHLAGVRRPDRDPHERKRELGRIGRDLPNVALTEAVNLQVTTCPALDFCDYLI